MGKIKNWESKHVKFELIDKLLHIRKIILNGSGISQHLFLSITYSF